ncbi:MAG: guanitoxin biosynthesis MBL fold metallo-hydrolase GntH, partial [Pseudomonadales bacterium]
HEEQRPEFFSNYYVPNTEELGPDEMRVTALGTGMPDARKAQAGGSWFVELGNGEKFFFDVGSSSQSNFAMLQVSYRDADKAFLSHLHVDHAGDLNTLWVSGWTLGRFDRPLRVWGPSGQDPELGTRYFLETLQEAWKWDLASRHGKLPEAGAEIEINEFDYSKTHVVYDHNGVKVTAFPAVHSIDGAVSYKLEWNGLSFAYSGDTSPNSYFVENTKGVDLSVHETFITAKHLEERYGYDRQTSFIVGEIIHTSPEAGGKVFNATQPRMAVGYHFFNDFDTAPEHRDKIRKHYSGPLTLAQDGMVFNVTKNDINVRLLLGPEHSWPAKEDNEAFGEAKRGKNTPMSDWLQKSMLFRPKTDETSEHSH